MAENSEIWAHCEDESFNFSNVMHLKRNNDYTQIHFVDGTTISIHQKLEVVQEWIDEAKGLC